jgi:hypothetical protein
MFEQRIAVGGIGRMNDPRLHVNEEPRNDFVDVAVGMAVTFGFFFLIALVATVIQLLS